MSTTFLLNDVVVPDFDSSLTDLIIDLDYLRRKVMQGTTPVQVFYQLKQIFHTLESVGSARIEGNNTTITAYIESKIENEIAVTPSIREIQNIERALSFIDDNIESSQINRAFLSEIHKIVVEGLQPPPSGEGDFTPGLYRQKNVKITKAKHVPPNFVLVDEYMENLFDFITTLHSSKYDLLKTAQVHHRFLWIHPFTNGNGRTVRLLTYAMLVKQKFNVNVAERIINPTAVFCSNRDEYYENLSKADNDGKQGMLAWCEYVLKGLKEEIDKVDKLADYAYLSEEILIPAIDFSAERKSITEVEAKILKRAVWSRVMKANNLKDVIDTRHSSEISRQIGFLIQKKMLATEGDNKRKYIINFQNNYLLRGIIFHLSRNGFLPTNE